MRCPTCGYLLDDLDARCPRCSAEESHQHDEAVAYVALHSSADAATARAALEACEWNPTKALARLGVKAPVGAPPPPAQTPPPGPAPPGEPTRAKGFGTPGTGAHRTVVALGIVVGVVLLAGVALVCLGLFGVAGPIRKPKVAEIPPPGTPPEVSMSADQLWEECAVNKAQATTSFVGKFARVTGNVRGLNGGASPSVVVAGDPSGLTGAQCYLAEAEAGSMRDLSLGQPVTVEGMISDVGAKVKLRQCRIVDKGAVPVSEPTGSELGEGLVGGE